MQPLALLVVLLSAATHVYWNLQVKRAADPAVYTWWMQVLGPLLFAPLALWWAWPPSVPAAGWLCVAGTGVLYATYFALIAHSYDRDDLSRAYPIARGVAPVATAAAGVAFFHEHPSSLGWAGIAAISAGVLVLLYPALRKGGAPLSWSGIAAAVATGLCTSGYAAVDKEGVRHVHPALYIVLTFAAGSLAQGLTLRPWQREEPLAPVRRHLPGLLLAAAAALGSYFLILLLLQTGPVSYIIPLRSASVLFSVFAGSRLLGEGEGSYRLPAALLILAGILAIAFGG